MKTANVFVVDQNAKLTEISAVTTTPNSEVSYEIYLLRSKYRNPYDGVKIQSGEGYTFEYGGYHRFELKEPVMLFRGQAYSVVISQKTPSGKSVFNIVCGEKHGSDLKEIRDDFPEEAPAEEYVDEWTEFIVNRRESYVLKDDEWLDLTTKKAYDALLGSGKKYAGDPDIYDNLPIKAYLEEAEQAAYPDPAADIAVGSMPGRNSKQVIFKLKGRGEEWDTNPVFTWTSSDTGIFTVETVDPEEGVMQITGISPGTAYLTISSEELGTRVVGVTVE
jgi:hypothetical protein